LLRLPMMYVPLHITAISNSPYFLAISGNDPKNVSDLTLPVARSRVVTVVTCLVLSILTTRSLEKIVSMKPILLPLLSWLTNDHQFLPLHSIPFAFSDYGCPWLAANPLGA
jgi:hypothetical protein